MKVFNSRPATWRDLQEFVGNLFKEIGYTVAVSKKIDLGKGKKEIDVYVQDLKSEFQTTFLIECKFWNKPVHQEVVHSFLTVIAAAGANFGFIVSKSGFQAGAYEAAERTNVYLVSLEKLEEKFYEKWQTGMAKRYMTLADRLFPYWEMYGGKQPQGGAINWDTHSLLNQAYQPFIRLSPSDTEKFRERQYPIQLPLLNDKFEIIGQKVIHNDRDYFDFIEENQEKVFRHYRILYREI